MKRLNWIESAGGPLIIISDNAIHLWSGIYKREPYLLGIYEDADDFMDSTEADYGKACLVDDYLGLIEMGEENCLVLGDEPMPTTFFTSEDNEINIARFYYYGIKDSEHSVDKLLTDLNLALIDNWKYEFTVTFNSDKQFLFDSAVDGKELHKRQENTDFLLSHLTPGKYKVFTAIFEPNEETKLFLHRLVATN